MVKTGGEGLGDELVLTQDSVGKGQSSSTADEGRSAG